MQTPPPRRFALPPGMAPDRSPPRSIVHGCDYRLTGHGFDFYDNYLEYSWLVEGREVRATAHLDRHDAAEVAIEMTFEELDQRKYSGVLEYLQRRYPIIRTREGSSYTRARNH